MQPLTFGLTGREFQEIFNVEKYTAMAYQQPRGLALQDLVEERWDDWCDTVTRAPWRTYWKRSAYWKQQCRTPRDQLATISGCGSVPLVIFSRAVWGFGIEEWLKMRGRAARKPLYEILHLQGVRDPRIITQRTHMLDDKLYRGCGLQLPAEFGDLDRWLEPLWQQVCSSSK